MATLLLVVIYLSFISLGVPDSLLGTAWPVLYRELGVPLASQSAVSILCSLATMISSMNSARIISRLGTGKVTAFSTLLTAAALLGFSFSGSFWFMCLMAIPLGLGAGCVDSALNNYVSIHYNATVMSFLHCFYGVGVMVSPYIMSVVINSAVGWRGGYRTASLIQALIGSSPTHSRAFRCGHFIIWSALVEKGARRRVYSGGKEDESPADFADAADSGRADDLPALPDLLRD